MAQISFFESSPQSLTHLPHSPLSLEHVPPDGRKHTFSGLLGLGLSHTVPSLREGCVKGGAGGMPWRL